MWWFGPQFLHSTDAIWTTQTPMDEYPDIPEQRATIQAFPATCNESDDILSRLKHKNNFLTVQNAMCYVLRFINNTNPLNTQRSGPISAQEARDGLNAVMRVVQMREFPDVYTGLQSPSYIVKDTRLKSLSLFMGDDKVIRVGGRLKFSSLAYSSKHPAILPSNHFFTLTVLNFIHRTHLHVGPLGLLAAARQKFWPIRGRNIVRQVCKKCVLCSKARPVFPQQRMGDLPIERVRQSLPFQNAGVDYCGPFYIYSGIRGKAPTKSYLAIFVCLATKAVHIEVASKLTTKSFMGVLKRFISSRGIPNKIISDNGTNFVGANNEMHELFNMLNCGDLNRTLQYLRESQQIDWVFAPPGSPHFGGIYEAAVKSAKFHLRRIMHNNRLSSEQFQTLVKQVEAVLNSRPLVPLPNDDTIDVLTPGHFLIGRPLMALPEPGVSVQHMTLLDRWELATCLFKQLWNRWSTEYIQELQHRYYWRNESTNIQVGTIVLLRDDNLPPLQWKMGRITQTHPGTDGLVRVVTVKTSAGEFRRAISRVAPLPIEIEQPVVQDGGE